eukprot:5251307-Pyramimonas_sp.AAC.1
MSLKVPGSPFGEGSPSGTPKSPFRRGCPATVMRSCSRSGTASPRSRRPLPRGMRDGGSQITRPGRGLSLTDSSGANASSGRLNHSCIL